MDKVLVLILIHCVFIHGFCVDSIHAQQQEDQSEGEFEVSVKGLPKTTIRFEQLVVDRDMDKMLNQNDSNGRVTKYVYRTEPAGYLGLSESEWIEDISFKLSDSPDVGSEIYREYSELLSDINETIWQMKAALGNYYKTALKATSMCGERQASISQSLDPKIRIQLESYNNLEQLKKMVVSSISRLREGDSCRELRSQYQKMMEEYSRSLLDLSQGSDSLKNRVEAVGIKLNQRDNVPLGK